MTWHSLLGDEAQIARALEVGREWLGDQHPAVACLRLGVAIHHGRLPSPFLRELEMLLSEGVLKVIVASPTLSQGLNLNAAVLLVPSLYRSGAPITGEELADARNRGPVEALPNRCVERRHPVHGTKRTSRPDRTMSVHRGRPEVNGASSNRRDDPERTSSSEYTRCRRSVQCAPAYKRPFSLHNRSLRNAVCIRTRRFWSCRGLSTKIRRQHASGVHPALRPPFWF